MYSIARGGLCNCYSHNSSIRMKVRHSYYLAGIVMSYLTWTEGG